MLVNIMIYNKSFTKTDLEFFLSTCDTNEVMFSFMASEGEPEVVRVAKEMNPMYAVVAATIPSVTAETLNEGLEYILSLSSDNEVEQLSSNYSGVDFGREELVDSELLKEILFKFPLTSLAGRILMQAKFSNRNFLEIIRFYHEGFDREKAHLLGLVRMSFNLNMSRTVREILFGANMSLGLEVELSLLSNYSLEEDEFLMYYELLPDRLKGEAVAAPVCPDFLKEEALDSGSTSMLAALAMSETLTEKQKERLLSLILATYDRIEDDGQTENIQDRADLLRATQNLLENRTMPTEFFHLIAEHGKILNVKLLHSTFLAAVASRIHEDISLHHIAQNLMASYNLDHEVATSVLLRRGDDESNDEIREMSLNVNNIIAYYYGLIRNPKTPTEVLNTVNNDIGPMNESISLTMLPHPNIGEFHSAGILNRVIGSPLESIAVLHMRNPEVMKIIAGRYDELSMNSKLALMLNPKVDGETYLELALQEDDRFLRDLLMRAGGSAHLKSKIGNIMLTDLNTEAMLEAWRGSGGNPESSRVSYASFNVIR